MAINPPVLVPPIRSKYLQGRGVSLTPLCLSISSIISLKIKSDDNPLTPPPSRDRRRGRWLVVGLRTIPGFHQQHRKSNDTAGLIFWPPLAGRVRFRRWIFHILSIASVLQYHANSRLPSSRDLYSRKCGFRVGQYI